MFHKEFNPKGLRRVCQVTLVGLLIVVCSVGLVACGDNTPQPGTGGVVTTTAATVATTVTTTTSATTPAATTSGATTKAASNPLVRFSATTLKVGDKLGITGSGYPAGVKLRVSLKYPDSNQFGSFATPTTDAAGNFTTQATLDNYDNGKPLDAGKVFVIVGTPDSTTAASAAITLVAAQPVPAYNPVVKASQTTVKRGQEIVLSGSGFPANIDLGVNGGVQNPANDYGMVKTDAAGNFSLKLTVGTKNVSDGLYFIFASTADFKWQNKVQLDILPANPATTVASAYNPVVKASQTTVKRSQEIVLTGSGFPATTDLSVRGGVQNPGNDYGMVKTDEMGNFSMKLTIPVENVYDGLYFIYASTTDFKRQNKVQLNILPTAS